MNLLYKILIIGCVFLLTSCENPFNPSNKNDNNQTNNVVVNDTPEKVLANLATAYQQKDIDIYKYCLADDFRFQLISTEVNDFGIDLDGDGLNDAEWGYQQEIKSHENLFINGSSDGEYPPPESIELIFSGTQTTPSTEEGQENWVMVYTYFNLSLYFENSIISAVGRARFYLKPVDDEWKIAIWRDESNIYGK